MNNQTTLDALIIGGGHNGLVCACYLAAAGLKVRILERRSIVGGAAVTEEFHPGFRNSVASYTVSLLNPRIIADLNLHDHGLKILERPLGNMLPLPGGERFEAGSGTQTTPDAVARFSKRDADRLPAFFHMITRVADQLRAILLETPPAPGQGLTGIWRMLQQGRRLYGLSDVEQRDLHEMFTRSAGEILDDWFESDPIKALFGFDAVVGNYAGPYSPGSGYVLLHHAFGEVNGKPGVWGHAVGGMGAITQAMAKEAARLDVDIQTEAPVSRVIVRSGRAVGVRLEDGTEMFAGAVVANVTPSMLYLELIDQNELDPDFVGRMRRFRCGSGTLRMNVALSALPRFECMPGEGVQPGHQAGIIIAPSLDYMETAWLDAKQYGWSRQPVIEMLIPSTIDDSLAPPGQHVASLFCQQFAPQLRGNRTWDEAREEVADLVIDTVTDYAPNFRESVVGRMVLTPLDLERKLGLSGGDIFHGSLGLDQLFSARPVLGYGAYRGPLRALYMCGSGTHPGGGVTGAPGHNAAHEILRDFGKRNASHLRD